MGSVLCNHRRHAAVVTQTDKVTTILLLSNFDFEFGIRVTCSGCQGITLQYVTKMGARIDGACRAMGAPSVISNQSASKSVQPLPWKDLAKNATAAS